MKKLKISEKNFIYNIILTLLICLIIFSYLAFFMPQVYLEKKVKKNETNIISIHKAYTRDKSYASIAGGLKDNMLSIYKPYDSNKLCVSTISFDSLLRVKDKNILDLLAYLEQADKNKFDAPIFEEKVDAIIRDLKDTSKNFFDIKSFLDIENQADNQTLVKKVGAYTIIKSKSITKDRSAHSFMVISYDKDGMYISVYPFIFDDISDIKETVLAAFPLIFLLIVVIVFLLNRYYSKMITDPIKELSDFTRLSKTNKSIAYDLDIRTNDEIEELSNDIRDLYESLTQNYKDLEKSSKQRDIFIKSASHELKTPLQSSMLLADGMIENIGKYKDRDTYLPELKNKLVNMQVLIEDLLYLNRLDENPIFEDIDLRLIMEESLNNHRDLLEKKNLSLKLTGKYLAYTDYDHFRIIFDNIIKNAVEYTKENGKIECDFSSGIRVKNYPTEVDPDILSKIREPYVSSKISKSKGIGMYIVESLLDDMGFSMDITYKDHIFTLYIKENTKKPS